PGTRIQPRTGRANATAPMKPKYTATTAAVSPAPMRPRARARASSRASAAASTRSVIRGGQRVRGDHVLGDGASADQVLLDDPFEHGGRAGAVPGALGVHDGDRPGLADLKTVRLGAIDPAPPDELQLLQALLQELP